MRFNDTLTETVRLDLETGQVPALMGEPGIGKSSFAEALARGMDTKAFVLACNQLADKADLTGARLVPTSDGKSFQQEFYPHAVVQAAIQYARDNPREWPILLFDEVNRTTPDVTSAILTMITMRRLGREDLPANLRIMVAGNDKGNVTALDDASISRFSVYRVEPEAATLVAILGDAINPHVKKVLTEHPELVFQKSRPIAFAVDGDDDDDTQAAAFADLMDAGEEMRQLTTPRTIDGTSRWLNAVDPAKLQEWLQTPATVGDRQTTMLNEILEAHLGETDFTTLLVAEIADSLAKGTTSAQSSKLSAPKPNCYGALKSATTYADLESQIASLTDHEKSGTLLHALYEKADNARLIILLAQAGTAFEKEHTSLLVQLASKSLLDEGNVEAITSAQGPAADTARVLLGAFN